MCILMGICICIWDVRVGKLIKTVSGHEDMINDMCDNFVSGGENNEDVVTWLLWGVIIGW